MGFGKEVLSVFFFLIRAVGVNMLQKCLGLSSFMESVVFFRYVTLQELIYPIDSILYTFFRKYRHRWLYLCLRH